MWYTCKLQRYCRQKGHILKCAFQYNCMATSRANPWGVKIRCTMLYRSKCPDSSQCGQTVSLYYHTTAYSTCAPNVSNAVCRLEILFRCLNMELEREFKTYRQMVMLGQGIEQLKMDRPAHYKAKVCDSSSRTSEQKGGKCDIILNFPVLVAICIRYY